MKLSYFLPLIFVFLLSCSNDFSTSTDAETNSRFYYTKHPRPKKTLGNDLIQDSLFFSLDDKLQQKILSSGQDKSLLNTDSVNFAFYYGNKLLTVKNNTLSIYTDETFKKHIDCAFPSAFKRIIDSYDSWAIWIGQDNSIYSFDMDCNIRNLDYTAYNGVKTSYGVSLFSENTIYNLYKDTDGQIKLLTQHNLNIPNTSIVITKTDTLYYVSQDRHSIYRYTENNSPTLVSTSTETIRKILLDNYNEQVYILYDDKISRVNLDFNNEEVIIHGIYKDFLMDSRFNLILSTDSDIYVLNTVSNTLTAHYTYDNQNIKLFSVFSSFIFPKNFIFRLSSTRSYKLNFFNIPSTHYGPRVILHVNNNWIYDDGIEITESTAGTLNIKAGFLLKNSFIELFNDKISVVDEFDAGVDEGSKYAISKDSNKIVAWATECVNYIAGDGVDTTWQDCTKALGPAVGDSYDVLSLGRGGSVVLGFANPIKNLYGADFVIFENGFSDGFLELGYVEVSTDGIVFTRFPNLSYTESPVGPYETINPKKIYNLGSKYRQGYGEPFDLEELKYNREVLAGVVDLSNIRYVKIIDITGDGTYTDTAGNIIYDPYKTYGSAGFDLDAIGVLNE